VARIRAAPFAFHGAKAPIHGSFFQIPVWNSVLRRIYYSKSIKNTFVLHTLIDTGHHLRKRQSARKIYPPHPHKTPHIVSRRPSPGRRLYV
jgi:hypothetical protein